MTASQTARRPATRTARKPASQAPAKPQPKPAAKAEPTIDLGAEKVTVWKPSVSVGGQIVARCPHQTYGHESEAAAKRCARSMIAQNAARSSQPTPGLDKLVSGAQGQTKAA